MGCIRLFLLKFIITKLNVRSSCGSQTHFRALTESVRAFPRFVRKFVFAKARFVSARGEFWKAARR
jgi:hypothetical protein